MERRKHYRTDTGLLYLKIANLAGADNAKQLVPSQTDLYLEIAKLVGASSSE